MIKVLILTDDIEKWSVKLGREFAVSIIDRRKDRTFIETEMFSFRIQTYVNESMRGYAFSCIILDKAIDEHMEYGVLMPCIKGSFIKTENYSSIM